MSASTGDPSRAGSQNRLFTQLFFLGAAILILLSFLPRFHGFRIMDDAYMFARYADNLIQGHGLSWNPGEGPVYGATSLLYTFSLVPFRLLAPTQPALSLFLASFSWGLVWLFLSWRLYLRFRPVGAGLEGISLPFFLLVLVTSLGTLAFHFSSGMDTMLALSWGTGWLLAFRREADGSWRLHWIGAVLGGLAWWVRPDMIIFSWGIPMVMLVLARGQAARRAMLGSLGLTVAVSGGMMGLAWLIAGAPLPLSFYAKAGGLYGAAFQETYKGLAFAELSRFVLRQWPLFLVSGFGLLIGGLKGLRSKDRLSLGIVAAVGVYLVYYTFFVLQVMGYGQRFYYPLLPFLFFLALQELGPIGSWLRDKVGISFTSPGLRFRRFAVLVLLGLFLLYGVQAVNALRKPGTWQQLGIFDHQRTYQLGLQDYWRGLDRFSALPDSLVLATTEVGMPAAMNPGKRILDLSGLNNPSLVKKGLSGKSIFSNERPDVLFLPHPDYADFRESLLKDSVFRLEYKLYPDTLIQSVMGIALWKKSVYLVDIQSVMDRVLSGLKE